MLKKKLWRWTEYPPFYLILYVLVALTFAGIYSVIGPKQFFDSAVVHEDVFPQERLNFNNFFGSLIAREANTSLRVDDPNSKKYSIIRPYQVNSTSLKDGLITGFMSYGFTNELTPAGPEFVCDFDFAMDPSNLWVSTYDKGSSILHTYIMLWATSHKYSGVGSVGVCDTNRDMLSMFPEGITKFGARYEVSKEKPVYVPLNDTDVQTITKFSHAFSGDPYYLNDDLARMLYFSATTITTVGFGDIVPISGVARLLTGIEAVLGWITAGLFINSVAQAARSSKPLS